MIRLALLLAFLALPAFAQPRDFSCVGAERLEEDTAILPFAARRDRLGPEGLAAIAPMIEEAKRAEGRNICVLGYAAAGEGGAETASRLAARRARLVSLELAKAGIERDRIRAEARTRGFLDPARRAGANAGGVNHSAGVRVVLLPATP